LAGKCVFIYACTYHYSILDLFLLKVIELEEKHEERSEVEEETNVPHSDNLEDQAKELKVATTFTWVLLPFLCFISCLDRVVIIIFNFWQFVVHYPVEANSKFLSRGSFNWV